MGQIVTLTTNWGYNDFFIGKVKGRLYSFIPDVQVVDITHGIKKFDILDTLFVVANTCFDFPQGTIHIIDVISTETIAEPFVIVKCEGQYFITIDNKIPAAIVGEREYEAVQINYPQDSNFYTFAVYNLFCYIAQELAQGTPLSDLGSPHQLNNASVLSYVLENNTLRLRSMYTDKYGNAYLNIKYTEFEKIRKGRDYYITIAEHRHSKIKISTSYEDMNLDAGTIGIVLTVSVTGYLQLAIKHESAAQMLGLSNYSTEVRIDFE